MINSINISEQEFINLINLGLGLYRPLKGFNTNKEFKDILLYKKINKVKSWTIPILLNTKKKKVPSLGENCLLVYKKKKIGIFKVKIVFKIEKNKFLKIIFNTISNSTTK